MTDKFAHECAGEFSFAPAYWLHRKGKYGCSEKQKSCCFSGQSKRRFRYIRCVPPQPLALMLRRDLCLASKVWALQNPNHANHRVR